MEVIVFFSSAVVTLLFLSSFQTLKGLGNLVTFSRSSLKWQCIHLPRLGLDQGDALVGYLVCGLRRTFASKLGHTEDLEEMLYFFPGRVRPC